MSLTTSEMTPADIAAVTRNNSGDGGMFGDNGWWIIILLLFGWGGNRGFGGGFGGGCGNSTCATQADLAAGFNNSTVLASLDDIKLGQAQAINYNNQGFNGLNTAILQGFHGVDNAICTLGYNMQGGFNSIAHQISDCCCETQRLIERGFCDTNYNLATQASETRNAICNSTRDIIDNQNANSRAILDFLTQDKIATLTAENQSLKFAASQAKQNQYLINELRPCPVPAYITCNPYAASYGCNNGCGGSF